MLISTCEIGPVTFKDLRPYHSMQIGLHIVEHQVYVFVVLGLDDIQEPDDVLVPVKLLQEHNLPECALRVRRVVEGVEDLLKGDHLLVLLVDGLPNDPVGALAQLLDDLELPKNMWL